MDNEITIQYNGKFYSAEYLVTEDILTVYLPDGGIAESELKGLKAESAAGVHIKSYIRLNS
ncbi:hypothetical protein [Desulfotalea psychrophila]|uniref:Uncharacterized protein n=1 Tax=Desulfotalea psychrophila (strain LSv54 / DSM 12343) TaxID=177439 RepID=Q6AQN0_DESPS|nr:hypothetical protein [Desulfotalea psychrophila]CAG35343.1 conserved hypothetical protein [Desulfotalea psychrophila LSv54]